VPPPCGGPPPALEAATLFGFIGDLGGGNVIPARVARATANYACGTAVQTSTGTPVGFLAYVSDSDAVLATQALVQAQPSGNTLVMDEARALVVRFVPGCGTTVTVVGTGSMFNTASGDVLASRQPMLAHVAVAGCVLGGPQLFMGNGDTQFVNGGYYDVALDPTTGGTALYVCGYGTQGPEGPGEPRVPVAYYVNLEGAALSSAALQGPGLNGVAVSLAALTCLLNVGVNLDAAPSGPATGALVWSLALTVLTSVAPVPMPQGTQYNDATTGTLRSDGSFADVVIVRLLADAAGRLFVVGRVNQGGPLAARALAVFAFDADTAPWVSFGALGIVTWAVTGTTAVASDPTDATLLPDGSLVVCGNAYPSSGGLLFSYDSTLPFLSTPPDQGIPSPFAVLLATGCPGGPQCSAPTEPALQILFTSLPGCAQGRLLTAVFAGNPKCLHFVGDVMAHLTCPAQPAGVLHAIAALACPVRLLNANPAGGAAAWAAGLGPAPVDGGPLRVDYCCGGRSTLMVAGPVVIGGSCEDPGQPLLPIPGTLSYDSATDRFLVCTADGTWRALVLEGSG
jgi:hypothetical protein